MDAYDFLNTIYRKMKIPWHVWMKLGIISSIVHHFLTSPIFLSINDITDYRESKCESCHELYIDLQTHDFYPKWIAGLFENIREQ